MIAVILIFLMIILINGIVYQSEIEIRAEWILWVIETLSLL